MHAIPRASVVRRAVRRQATRCSGAFLFSNNDDDDDDKAINLWMHAVCTTNLLFILALILLLVVYTWASTLAAVCGSRSPTQQRYKTRWRAQIDAPVFASSCSCRFVRLCSRARERLRVCACASHGLHPCVPTPLHSSTACSAISVAPHRVPHAATHRPAPHEKRTTTNK